MIFKLIKYEFRSMLRMMGILWGGLPVMAIVTAAFQKFFAYDGLGEYPDFLNLMDNLFTFVYISMFIALVTVTVVIIIMRFYKGLIGDEGYLMHTLPVKTWQLITAKGVTAVTVSVISIAVAVLSILMLSVFEGYLTERMGNFFTEFFGLLAERPSYWVLGIETMILIIACLMAMIYKVYASLSLGQMAPKHKIAFSVAIYIGISIAGPMLMSAFGNVVSGVLENVLQPLEQWVSGLSTEGGEEALVAVSMLLFIIFEAVLIAVYHIVSEQSLRRKLNLE